MKAFEKPEWQSDGLSRIYDFKSLRTVAVYANMRTVFQAYTGGIREKESEKKKSASNRP